MRRLAIPQDKIEQVRLASDVVDVVSGYVTLKKRGKNYFGLCPFHHEKSASFSVNPDLQIFHCFGCGAGGNVFTFIMRIEGLTFPESVRMLAKAAGIVLPDEEEDPGQLQEKEALYYANGLANEFFMANLLREAEAEPARRYLASRGLTPEAFARFHIGYSLNKWDGLLQHARAKSLNPDLLVKAGLAIRKEDGKIYDRFRGRITFAIHSLSKQVVAFGARRIVQDDSPKYINSPETGIYQKRYILYGLHLAREAVRQADRVVIVEGYTDLISLHMAGIEQVVATSGTAMTEEHARLLRRYTAHASILYDGDSAGAAASLRGAEILLANGFDVRIAMLPGGQDPDEFVRQSGADAVRRHLQEGMALIDFKMKSLEQKGLLRTPSQKAESTRELLASIARVADTIQKSFLLRDLAEKLNVEEAVLWAEVHKLERRLRQQPRSEEKKSQPVKGDRHLESKRGAAELGLLEMALTQPELLPRILSLITADEFIHVDVRAVFEGLELDALEGVPFEIKRYLAMIRDPGVAGVISRALEQLHKPPHPARYTFDCLNTIRIAKLDERIEALRARMKGGEKPGEELLAEYRAVVEERKRLEQIEFAFE
ncbi:MAG TPA: DNA primase [bacterium]|nr:DNA primase [bacterium]